MSNKLSRKFDIGRPTLCGQGHVCVLNAAVCGLNDPKLHGKELPLGGAVSPCGGEHRLPPNHGASAQKVDVLASS